MLKIDILTLFPEIIKTYTNESIIKRAQEKKLAKITARNIRDFATDKRRKVDDRPFGGGAGMLLMAEPILRAIDKIGSEKILNKERRKIIILSPRGKQFTQIMAQNFSQKFQCLILIGGRYEGIDERVKKILKAEEISIGPYVLTDGDLGALAITSSVIRLLPGVLGNSESLSEESFTVGAERGARSAEQSISHELKAISSLEYPHYTRPEILKYKGKNYRTPKVLLSGDHKKIKLWRQKEALKLAKKSKY